MLNTENRIARKSENDFLESRFKNIFEKGTGTTVLVSGEAGAGKTTLIKDFIKDKKDKNKPLKFLKVIPGSGFCLEMDHSLRGFYSWEVLFEDLLSNMITLFGGHKDGDVSEVEYKKIIKDVFNEKGADLFNLVPFAGVYLSTLFKTIKELIKKTEIQKSLRDSIILNKEFLPNTSKELFNKIISQIRELAGEHIVILFIDDIHCFDSSSRDLFLEISADLAEDPYRLLLIGSYRPEEISDYAGPDKHPLEELLSNIQKFYPHEELTLKLNNFSETQIREYINLQFPQNDITDDLVKYLENLTGGNILFLKETITNFIEKKYIYETDGVYRNEEYINYTEVPKSISEVIEERFKGLGDFREILQVASIMGEDFSVEIIRSILPEENSVRFNNKIRDLNVEHKIIEKVNKAYDKLIKIFRFVNNHFQKHVYFSSLEEDRIEYHKLVSETIRKYFEGENIKKVLDQYTFHFGIGNRIIDYNSSLILEKDSILNTDLKEKVEEFLNYSKELTDKYEKAYSNSEAIKRLNIMIGIESVLDNKLNEIDYKLRCGKISELIGKWDKAEEQYNSALMLSEELADSSRIADSKKYLGNLFLLKGEYEKALSNLNESTALFRETGDERGIAQNLLKIGNLNDYKGEYELAISNYEKALSIREKLGDRVEASFVIINLGNAYFNMGDLKKAETLYNKGVDISKELDNKQIYYSAIKNLGSVKFQRKKYTEAGDQYKEALNLYQLMGDKKRIAGTYINIGLVNYKLGYPEESLKNYQQAFKIYEKLGDLSGLGLYYFNSALVLRDKKEFDNSLENFRKAFDINQRLGDKKEIANCFFEIGIIYSERENYSEAFNNFDKAILIGKEIQVNFELCEFLYMKAQLLFKSGKIQESIYANIESLELSEKTGRDEIVFDCKILSAKLESISDKAKAKKILEEMTVHYTQEYQSAALYYEMYKLFNSNNERTKALEAYIKLHEKTPGTGFASRIKELKDTEKDSASYC